MYISHILSSIGLFLDASGAVMIFFFGIPDNIRKDGHGYLLLLKVHEDIKKKAKKYSFLSKIALTLIIIGFILQLIANWV